MKPLLWAFQEAVALGYLTKLVATVAISRSILDFGLVDRAAHSCRIETAKDKKVWKWTVLGRASGPDCLLTSTRESFPSKTYWHHLRRSQLAKSGTLLI